MVDFFTTNWRISSPLNLRIPFSNRGPLDFWLQKSTKKQPCPRWLQCRQCSAPQAGSWSNSPGPSSIGRPGSLLVPGSARSTPSRGLQLGPAPQQQHHVRLGQAAGRRPGSIDRWPESTAEGGSTGPPGGLYPPASGAGCSGPLPPPHHSLL